jgi:hypothetical protein
MDEERHMREFQMNQLKSSWEDAMRKRTAEREAPPGTDFDVQNCGPASLIVMKGEDLQGGERSKQAKEQMRVWIQQQIAEKAYMKGRDADENLNYADMIKVSVVCMYLCVCSCVMFPCSHVPTITNTHTHTGH